MRRYSSPGYSKHYSWLDLYTVKKNTKLYHPETHRIVLALLLNKIISVESDFTSSENDTEISKCCLALEIQLLLQFVQMSMFINLDSLRHENKESFRIYSVHLFLALVSMLRLERDILRIHYINRNA